MEKSPKEILEIRTGGSGPSKIGDVMKIGVPNDKYELVGVPKGKGSCCDSTGLRAAKR